jgi:hypothetical protein
MESWFTAAVIKGILRYGIMVIAPTSLFDGLAPPFNEAKVAGWRL